jgi:hypothetical protein
MKDQKMKEKEKENRAHVNHVQTNKQTDDANQRTHTTQTNDAQRTQRSPEDV